MKLESPNFRNGGMIPPEFTCDGSNLSPTLLISDVPSSAQSLALIMDDPDAPMGTFVHWVVWNIPPTTAEIQKGAKPAGVLGRSGFGKAGYGGPCPPSGTHRYYFKLYALSTPLGLKEGSSKEDLLEAMKGCVLSEAMLMGTYQRKK